ncbi:MAG: RNA-binding S4 domain-containing protein [Bauldia sp.]
MSEARQRIDKWLWFARVSKTRTLAQKLVLAGKVRVNREKSNAPSDLVRIGDVLTIALESGIRIVRVTAPGTRRGPPAEARLLFDDLSPPAEQAPPRTGSRPTKRDRRRLDAFQDPSGDRE